jgi:putative transcriptional regulator
MIRQTAGLSAALLLLALGLPLAESTGAVSDAEDLPRREFLTGKLLVAHPDMGDPRFRRTVVFMARHDENGAFGLVVNRFLGRAKLARILEEMGADPEDIEGEIRIHYGGPVEPKRGAVLHSTDYEPHPLIVVNKKYAVTMSAEILKAMARGEGPERSLLVLGYAGWAKGQLEGELKKGGWVVAPADEGILFDEDYETKWERAFASRYIST